MSQKLQEKQQTQEQKQQHDADSLLNKHIFNTLAYTFGGYAAGMGASLFFKRRAAIPLLMAGAGAGYGINNMYNDMNRLKQFQGQGGSSNTLKRDEQLGTKEWDRYQQKEESLQTQKPRYGGSDSDDSDKSKTETKGSQKSQTQSKDTSRQDTSKGGKSHEGTDPKHDQKKLFNIEGKAYDNRGDSSIQPKQSESGKKDTHKEQDSKGEKSSGQKGASTQSGSKGSSSHGKESESVKKESHKDEKSSHKDEKSSHKDEKSKGSKSSSNSDKADYLMTGKPGSTKAGPPSSSIRPADIKGSKIGGDENLQKDKVGKHLSNDDTELPGSSKEGTSRLNRRGGEQTERVKEDLKERGTHSLPLQDKWGATNKTGFKNQTNFPPENKAGGEFRGKSTAGSQVNAVIE